MAPVLVNSKTGLAENLPQDQADQALQQGTHEIPFNDPQGNPVTAPLDQVHDLISQGYTQPSEDQLNSLTSYAKHSSVGQQALAGLEGAAQGVAGPLATLAETSLGVDPNEIRAREEANPGTHKIGEAAGFLGSALMGTGEAALLGKAGEAATTAAKLGGEGAGLLSRVGSSALRGGVEMGLMQGGDEVSKFILNDPNQSAETAAANIGLSALLGAGLSAPFGAVSPLWKATKGAETEQALQDFKNSLSGSVSDPAEKEAEAALKDGNYFSNITKSKPNADEIVKAAQENNWPVLEGMTSGSKEVQMAEDALVNGPPSFSSIARREAYDKAYKSASNSLDNSISQDSLPLSETQIGDKLKESLQSKLDESYQPIKDLYSEIEPYRNAIPVSDKSLKAISRNIMKIAEEKGIPQGTDRYNFLKNFSEGLTTNDNLQKIANFRTEVGKAAGPLNKDLAQAIVEKLDGVEERSIKSMADNMKTPEAKEKLLSLLDKSDQARAGYREFREKLQTLGNSLGKKKIYGPQNFQDFLEDLNPQTLVRRLFNENNTTFAKYFAEEFPEEMQSMRGYQRNLIRQNAIKEGIFNPKSAIKEINGLEPEMRDLLFTKEEQKLVNQAETYLNSFPKKFNPSGTAHESAFRSFFEHPTGAIAGNIRDFAIERFIKAAGSAGAESGGTLGKVLSVLGQNAAKEEANGEAFKNAVEFVQNSIKGENNLSLAAKAVFVRGMEPAQLGSTVADKRRDKLQEKLDDIAQNQSQLLKTGGQTGYYLPNHGSALSGVAARAFNTLNASRPGKDKLGPLDQELPKSKADQAQYERQLTIADQPMTVMNHIKDGTLTLSDVKTLQSIYPNLYERMKDKLTHEMISHTSKGESIPYKTRMSLSLFMGTPLDATMSQPAIQSAQQSAAGMPATPPTMATPQRGPHSMKGIQKLPNQYRTPAQAREMDRLTK